MKFVNIRSMAVCQQLDDDDEADDNHEKERSMQLEFQNAR